MKHRMISVVLLTAALVLLLAVPVAADRKTHPVTFTQTGWVESWDCRSVAKDVVWLCTASASFTLDSGDPILDGLVFSEEIRCNLQLETHTGGWWGPCIGKWRIVTQVAGKESGWEGTLTMQSWTDPAKWPRTGMIYYRGQGLGAYAATQIKYEVLDSERVYTGEIYGLD